MATKKAVARTATAIPKLPTNFQDDILNTEVSDKRIYQVTEVSEGVIALEDVSTYVQVGSDFGAEQINETNGTVNALIDKTSQIDNTPDNQKRVAYAETAGVATLAEEATNAVTAQTAQTAQTVENVFDLKKKATLTFNNNNICIITDSRITADSLADVYFTQESVLSAEKAVITVETYNGRVELKAGRTPESDLVASIVIRVVE